MADGKFEFTRHAFRRVVERNIGDQEIREAGAEAEVITAALGQTSGSAVERRPAVAGVGFEALQ